LPWVFARDRHFTPCTNYSVKLFVRYPVKLAGVFAMEIDDAVPENPCAPGRSKVWRLSTQQALFFPPIDSKVAIWCRGWELGLPLFVSKNSHRSEDST